MERSVRTPTDIGLGGQDSLVHTPVVAKEAVSPPIKPHAYNYLASCAVIGNTKLLKFFTGSSLRQLYFPAYLLIPFILT